MYKLVFILVFLSQICFSQIGEGQKFCEESKDGTYFPVDLFNLNTKKILWYKTYYKETKENSNVMGGKTYVEFTQEWENGDVERLYLREQKGVVYQYDPATNGETIRYDNRLKEGFTWKYADGKNQYKIISYNGELKTPYCKYRNLLVIEAIFPSVTFNFYYLKGHGYVGATKKGILISCVTPE